MLPVALELRRRGREPVFLVRELLGAEVVLAPHDTAWFQAPLWTGQLTDLPDAAGYAELLMRFGFLNPFALAQGAPTTWLDGDAPRVFACLKPGYAALECHQCVVDAMHRCRFALVVDMQEKFARKTVAAAFGDLPILRRDCQHVGIGPDDPLPGLMESGAWPDETADVRHDVDVLLATPARPVGRQCDPGARLPVGRQTRLGRTAPSPRAVGAPAAGAGTRASYESPSHPRQHGACPAPPSARLWKRLGRQRRYLCLDSLVHVSIGGFKIVLGLHRMNLVYRPAGCRPASADWCLGRVSDRGGRFDRGVDPLLHFSNRQHQDRNQNRN